jgi:transcription-repair coupling factor (superfamily II helicase)
MHDFSVHGLTERIRTLPALQQFVDGLARLVPGEALSPIALPETARSVVAAAVAESVDRPVLWLAAATDEARAFAECIASYIDRPDRVHLLPPPDALPYERIPWDPATREHRMAALAALHRWSVEPVRGRAPVIVAAVRGLMLHTLPPATFRMHARHLRRGDRQRVTDLLHTLHLQGYERVSTVTEPGQVARRGGILDVYVPSEPAPVRIEWFGDDIDSLRPFSPVTQRSQRAIDEVVIIPASEALAEDGARAAASLASLSLARLHPIAQSELRRHLDQLARGERFPGIEFFGPLLHPDLSTALDYCPDDTLVLIDGADQVRAAALGFTEQAAGAKDEQIAAGELPDGWPASPIAAWTTIEAGLSRMRRCDVAALGADRRATASALATAFGTPSRYGGQIEDAAIDAVQTAERGHAVVIVSRQAPRFAEVMGDVGPSLAALVHLDQAPGPGGIALVHGALPGGWTLHGGGGDLVVLSDHELFGWRMPHRRRRARSSEASRVADYFAELSPGDHVVHIEHGIGLFRGLARMMVGSAEHEYFQIEYAQGDMLYVPTHQADRVARYVGTGDVSPSVSRLGTADWERAKKRARRAVEDIARELLVFYARRELAQRTPFAQDHAWQVEMEAAFPYLETDDQLRAIEDVKRDMEGGRPMDRLVVGDVGFGKTEVALRAAFKAVMGGRQVAILAPTTVLAQQHYETFRQRFAAFPVRVEMLSRFRSRSEQVDIAERLATREIDIVVGTHRLLSPDVRFFNLGLLVIDEEHRFGVKHKERMRQMRESVDTLTLTATPIPRTMHMALSGLRDLTTIDTPPEERLPVVTHIGPHEDNLVRQAVRRELARQGQVFYVHNRVRGIDQIAQRVARLVPEARIGIAHGQLHEDDLARAMLAFVAGATDVLVCTSIVESGLDIQNANTLVVDRADRFGLAQLHQLRGRVGRGAQRAYAYFLHAPGHDLPPDARQRLEALADAQALGSGFRLAMRDLELRGAGEILGARQHGQVSAIGLDLYTRLLAEAIKKLQADRPAGAPAFGEELSALDPSTLPTVDLPLDAHLPETYVAETSARTRLYRRMAVLDTLAGVEDLARELDDRFGPPPAPVANLIGILRLRVLAHLADARSVGFDGNAVVVRWRDTHALRRAALKVALPPEVRIGQHQITVPVGGPPGAWLGRVRHILEAAAEIEVGGDAPGVTPGRPPQ